MPEGYVSGEPFTRNPAAVKKVFDDYMNDRLGARTRVPEEARSFGSQSGDLGSFLASSGGGGRTPSPGGLDLHALLNRGIQGTMAGAQEETGIRRRKDASDLLTAQLSQAAQELQNRMHGYEFEQEKQFDTGLAQDPRLQASLADAFSRSGNPFLTAPTSRHALAAYHQFGPAVQGHNEIAASILKNYQLTASPGAPDPPEVAWAKKVLGVGGAGGGQPPSNPPPDNKTKEQVPFGALRAAGTGVVGGVGAYGGSKLFEAGAKRFAPSMSPGKMAAGKFGSGLVGAGIGQTIYNLLGDPRGIEAEREHPIAALGGTLVGGYATGKAAEAVSKVPWLARLTSRYRAGQANLAQTEAAQAPSRLQLPAPQQEAPSGMATTPQSTALGGSAGGPQMGDFVRRFKTFYNRNPTAEELESFARGQGPTGGRKLLPAPTEPYKPNVKGHEEFIKQYFGER